MNACSPPASDVDSEQTDAPSQQSEDRMDTDDYPDGDQESHLWGYLQPYHSTDGVRIDCWKVRPSLLIGRGYDNHIILEDPRISTNHCTINWDGNAERPVVTVVDLSTNGTFVNGHRIGRNKSRVIRDGQEISFGASSRQQSNSRMKEYRYIYRQLTQSAESRLGLSSQEYQLIHAIGKGSFGTVYKVLHMSSGVLYAVKQIKYDVQSGSNEGQVISDRIAREVSIMESLNHPNICKLYQVAVTDPGSFNLLLEYADNGDLWQHVMDTPNGLSELHTKDIIYQICNAIEYVHQRGIAHRDLKPENILLTSGKFPMVKVTDFGLSKATTNSSLLWSIVGTPIYLAPEIMNEIESFYPTGYDNRVDIFSIGGIVHLWTEPFSTSKTTNMLARVKGRVRNMKALHNAHITANALNFIDWLLEEDPKDRPAISQVFSHSWLARYKPRGGVPRARNSGQEDTEESTARENDDTDSSKSATRAMTRAQKKEMIRRANARRKVRIMAPIRGSSSSTSFELDVLPATARRRKETKVVNTPTRRSMRSSTKKKLAS